MAHLCHVWGYDGDDIGKKTVSAIIYKYLKQQMFLKAHVPTAFLSVKFMMTSSIPTSTLLVKSTKEEHHQDLGTEANPRSGRRNSKTVK